MRDGPGGQDAVVDFTVPAKANLTIEWAQVGNHDFALYTDVNDLAACDAGTLVSCTPSMDQSTGTIALSELPGGKYHLIVDADHAGRRGRRRLAAERRARAVTRALFVKLARRP